MQIKDRVFVATGAGSGVPPGSHGAVVIGGMESMSNAPYRVPT